MVRQSGKIAGNRVPTRADATTPLAPHMSLRPIARHGSRPDCGGLGGRSGTFTKHLRCWRSTVAWMNSGACTVRDCTGRGLRRLLAFRMFRGFAPRETARMDGTGRHARPARHPAAPCRSTGDLPVPDAPDALPSPRTDSSRADAPLAGSGCSTAPGSSPDRTARCSSPSSGRRSSRSRTSAGTRDANGPPTRTEWAHPSSLSTPTRRASRSTSRRPRERQSCASSRGPPTCWWRTSRLGHGAVRARI